ncbi:MAG: sulfurtransferase [Gammaproteobacteria bacterium]|nr:sulfurtransferase [Gammaproteobacteria bacterium]
MEYRTLIDAPTLATLLSSPGVAVIDCRFDLARPAAGRAAYLQGHLPGARYTSLDEDLSGPVAAGTGRHPLPEPAQLARRLGELGVGEGIQVFAYDEHNGSFAARLWWLLRWLGHERVAVLDGGWTAWRAAGGPIEAGEGPPARAHFTPRPNRAAWTTADEVAAAQRRGDRLLVDARARERFTGAVEPIDKVAGHVPGARNYPFSENLGADGRFLPAAELARRWRSFLGDTPPERLIAMCGSGVTACHDLLALEHAGLGGGRLYAGSFSEWIEDPARRVAVGESG